MFFERPLQYVKFFLNVWVILSEIPKPVCIILIDKKIEHFCPFLNFCKTWIVSKLVLSFQLWWARIRSCFHGFVFEWRQVDVLAEGSPEVEVEPAEPDRLHLPHPALHDSHHSTFGCLRWRFVESYESIILNVKMKF